MCLSLHWCVLSLWCDAICLTIYSQTGLAATQTEHSATVTIMGSLGETDGYSVDRKLYGPFSVCFSRCAPVHRKVFTCLYVFCVWICMLACLTVRLCMYVYICMFSASVRTQGPCNQHRGSARQGYSPPLGIVGPRQPELKTTSRTKWVNSVWHVFNMVTLEQAAFDWKANIQAMQIINHGKRPINYSIKQSNSRINVGKWREGWAGSQQRGRERERLGERERVI